MTVRFPHPLALLVGCIGLAAVLTWVLPAGTYQRRDDASTGRKVVVAGTYHAEARHPVGPFGALLSVPRGIVDAAEVVAAVFLMGAAFAVVERTGALAWGVERLTSALASRDGLVIPVVSVAFGAAGALTNMQEEIIALMPPLLLLAAGLGYRPIVAVAMSLGAAGIGATFSPVNPYQVGIAQKLAELPLGSSSGLRTLFLVVAMLLWMLATRREAVRTRLAPAPRKAGAGPGASGRQGLILTMVGVAYVLIVVGLIRWEWGFNELSATLLCMGVMVGLVAGLGVSGTAEELVVGFRTMAFAALLIGFARAVYVVLEQGMVVDTIVNGIFSPLSHLSPLLSALGMIPAQALVHVLVPSVSGQAVLTMPVLVPLSDLLGISRQATVLAYQTGAGLTDLVTPTNGALMAILAAARVPFGEWLQFMLKWYVVLVVTGGVAVAVAVLMHVA